jgi:hypothetical protein
MSGPPPVANLGPLRYQLEFYFSPQNLVKDNYLLTQLNSPDHPGAVHMGVVCNFPKVRQINALLYNMGHLSGPMAPTADPNLVRMALQQSNVVTVSADGAWLLPVDSSVWVNAQHKPPTTTTSTGTGSTGASAGDGKIAPSNPSSPSSQATASSSLGVPTHPLPPAAEGEGNEPLGNHSNIIVVVDVPDTVAADALVAIFTIDDSLRPSARRLSNNSWELDFHDETAARRALAASRDRTIHGSPVRAWIKSEARLGINETDGAIHRAVNPGMPPFQAMHMGYPVSMPVGYPFPTQPPPQMAFYGYNYPIPQQIPMGVPHQAFYHPPQGYNPGLLRNAYPAQGRPPPSHASMNGGRQPYAQQQMRNNNVQRNDRGPGFDANNRKNMVKNWQPKNAGTRGGKQPESSSLPGPQPKDTDPSKFDGGNRHGNKSKNNNNKNPQRQLKGEALPAKKENSDTRLDLGAENFPALGGGKPVTALSDRSFSVATGYAAALRKNATASQTPTNIPARTPECDVPVLTLDEGPSQLGSHE